MHDDLSEDTYLIKCYHIINWDKRKDMKIRPKRVKYAMGKGDANMWVVEDINEMNMYESFAIEEPDECPLCHYSIKPTKLSVHYYEYGEDKNVAGLYVCNHCFQAFMTLSVASNEKTTVYNRTGFKTELKYFGPIHFANRDFEPEINDLSPQFVKIYNQALHAEQTGLDEIAGIGYRKSVEFLVKDYCIHLNENPNPPAMLG